MKKCKYCDQVKDTTEFYAHKTNIDGLNGKCKSCIKDYSRARRVLKYGEPAPKRVPPEGHKHCSICEQVKPVTEFHREKSNSDGRAHRCRTCSNDLRQSRRSKNRGHNVTRLHKDYIVYASAHTRVYTMWGSATQYPCITCGEAADDWAYDGCDPHELVSDQPKTRGCAYSMDPQWYMPLCQSCHKVMDNSKRKEKMKAA